MFFTRGTLLVAGLGGAIATPSDLTPRQEVCFEGGITQIFISTQVYSYPIVIDTYIEANTVININGGVFININNAPTQLSTTVTATSTVTITSTAENGNGAVATPFLLAAAPVAAVKRRAWYHKRQSSGQTFIGTSGASTTNCSDAAIFTIQSGELFSNGEKLSTDPGVALEPFAVSPIIGSITGHFSGAGNFLAWENGNFTNGAASFCDLAGVIEVAFSNNITAACTPVELSIVPASACTVGVLSSSSSTLSSTSSSSSSSSSTSTSSPSTITSTSTSIVVDTSTTSTTAPSSTPLVVRRGRYSS